MCLLLLNLSVTSINSEVNYLNLLKELGAISLSCKVVMVTSFGHALERLAQRGITKKMAGVAISRGLKFYDPKNKSINYVLKNAFGSGKDILIGTNPLTGEVLTVLRGTNLIRPRMLPIELPMKVLENILSDIKNRTTLIKDFQERIWNGKGYGNDEKINEILADLAYDLDFYEPNEDWRKESPSYYGDKRLRQEIQSALEKIKEHKSSTVLNKT